MKGIRYLVAVTSAICCAFMLLICGAYSLWGNILFWIIFALLLSLHIVPLFFKFSKNGNSNSVSFSLQKPKGYKSQTGMTNESECSDTNK